MISLCNAAESSSSSSSSHKCVDVHSMSGLSHGNERAREQSLKQCGVIIVCQVTFVQNICLICVICCVLTFRESIGQMCYPSQHRDHWGNSKS